MQKAVLFIILFKIIYSISAANAARFTRIIKLKQGRIQGVVVEASVSRQLPDVEQYLGIPYAAAPVGKLRFMPPGSAPQWEQKLMIADSFGPVCPQRFPNRRHMPRERQEYFQRIERQLRNQSEDCLYLNIYSPVQDPENPRIYPVMVYIHGGDFEWDAGSSYDGSVLAAYGHVIVITLNFRLGILGFLKPGLEDESKSNFGLIDQIAALLWIQDNIDKFGGDPNKVTLFGQGSGAVCANFLMMSPMIIKERDKLLFQRAILMSGSALSDWALVKNPTHVTLQVAKAVGCPSNGKELEECLRKKRLKELMDISISIPDYQTKFGPIIDQTVIPNYPQRIMSAYNDIFKRFELIYGVMEIESAHLLNNVAMAVGMLQEERNAELKKYFETKFESNVGFILAHSLSAYSRFIGTDTKGNSFDGQYYDSGFLNRDILLNILSDVRTVAPVTLMAKLHSALNQNSYFYVFGHKTTSNAFYRSKSISGDELPYVFGVPIDGPKNHFQGSYSEEERIFSEVVMTYFTNFAHTGDPNIPRRNDFYTMHPLNWKRFNVDWVSYDSQGEPFMYLNIPPQIGFHYRHREIAFWNDEMPKLLKEQKVTKIVENSLPNMFTQQEKPIHTFRKIIDQEKHNLSQKQLITTKEITNEDNEQSMSEEIPRSVLSTNVNNTNGNSVIVITVGSLFLLTNIFILALLYYKCVKLKKRNRNQRNEPTQVRGDELFDPDFDGRPPEPIEKYEGCSFMKIISKSSRSEDTYEAVKLNEGVFTANKTMLIRQMSNSTIDPHSKVIDWISHDVVQKCSPHDERKSKIIGHSKINSIQNVEQASPSNVMNKSDSTSTINRSPTRPVSPCEQNFDISIQNNSHVSTLPVQKVSSSSNKFVLKSIKKPEKVSVAVDATPSGRGSSVLRQKPIELLKSQEFSSSFDSSDGNESKLKRSVTLDDVKNLPDNSKQQSDTLCDMTQATVVRIEHHHSSSDPVDNCERIFPRFGLPLKRLRSFDPQQDVNVTSKDVTTEQIMPLSPEQQLMTIKRRNFPKVLPDHPSRRMSMPTSNQLFNTIPESTFLLSSSQPTSPSRLNCKFPPTPPPRTTSSLGRNANQRHPLMHSEAVLAEEPHESPEPEITCNNLYVGPLLPVKGIKKPYYFTKSCRSQENNPPIYDNLEPRKENLQENKIKPVNQSVEVKVKNVQSGDKNKMNTSILDEGDKPFVGQNNIEVIGNNQKEQNQEQTENDKSEKRRSSSVTQESVPIQDQSKTDTDVCSSDSSETSDTGTVVNKT